MDLKKKKFGFYLKVVSMLFLSELNALAYSSTSLSIAILIASLLLLNTPSSTNLSRAISNVLGIWKLTT